MDNNINISVDASQVSAGLAEASAEIDRIARDEIAPAAALIEDAFGSAARTIETSLSRAARTGSFSLRALGRALTRDLVDSLVRRPIEGLLTNALTGVFGGGRAGGGFVAPGASFLVGERGPEMFTPSASGTITPLSGNSGVTVNIALPGVRDAEGFRRSDAQIAAALARAVGRGQRNL
ncbi:MAG: phage tail tape measure C-terminal domain-containing protein [Pseudomonadota bacterium]